MGYPDLPASVKAELANRAMREHHHIWHLVRNRDSWQRLPLQDREGLASAGWKAPRFDDEPGAGLDFLGMHREMVAHVNHLMHGAGDSAWPSVSAWDPIPWDENDPDWPVPPAWLGMDSNIESTKSSSSVRRMRQLADDLQSESYLRANSLDQVGTDIEFTIHGWMHLRWSAEPHDDLLADGVENDWLAAPFSSHVNKHFWKLHGWIDARIGDWERANDTVAELAGAWSGTGHALHGMERDAHDRSFKPSMADLVLFRVDEDRVRALSSGSR